MRRIILSCLVLALVLSLTAAGCGGQPGSAEPDPAANVQEPAPMPEDFQISFSWWIVRDRPNGFDTELGIVTKDLVEDGTAEETFEVTDELRSRLWEKLVQTNLHAVNNRAMTSRRLATDEMINAEPNTHYSISWQENGQTYSVSGDSTASFYREENAMAESFCSFIAFAVEQYQQLPEVQALPEGRGAYE